MNKILKSISCLGLAVLASGFNFSFASEENKNFCLKQEQNVNEKMLLASIDDIHDIINAYKSCFSRYIGDRYFEECFNMKEVKVYKYVVNGESVSYAIVEEEYSSFVGENIYDLCLFFTKSKYQRKGYGTKFLKELTETLSDKVMQIISTDRGMTFYPKQKFLIRYPKYSRNFWNVPIK